MAIMLVRKKYGESENIEQICSRCGDSVEWKNQGRVWSPTDPGTGKFHICKGAGNDEER